MPLFTATPKRNDKPGFDEQGKMFGYALARHAQMAAELSQRLAVMLMELIEKSPTPWISEGFEDLVHSG